MALKLISLLILVLGGAEGCSSGSSGKKAALSNDSTLAVLSKEATNKTSQ